MWSSVVNSNQTESKLKQLITEREAARLLNISVSTLRRLRKAGKIKAQKVGSQVRYRIEDLEK